MSKDSVTLVLEGDVPLDDYGQAIGGLVDLLSSLSEDVASGTTITWIVDSLASGSALTTVRGVISAPEDEAILARVVDAFENVGESLSQGNQLPFSEKSRRSAQRIISTINGHVKSVRFETEDQDFTI